MIKLNANYSDYTDETDPNYPVGKAENASSSESYDGTPILADLVNDLNASHIAMYKKAYGNTDGISGEADTQNSSQFADAVAKYTDDKVKDHADERGLAHGVHGATSEPTPGQLVTRDEYGCAQVADPIQDNDIANRKWVLDAIYPVGSLYWSSKSTNPASLFGGTWVQIKEKFILAAGDSYAAGSTGGASTKSLEYSNMPSHRHGFTPEGTVEKHTHNLSWSGSHGHSDNGHSHSITFDTTYNGGSRRPVSYDNDKNGYTVDTGTGYANISETWISINQNVSDTQPSFFGTAGNTSYEGSGTAFSIMPPYIVKYCFERTA